MKIYTKTGDKGITSFLGGMRVPKDSLRIETYGTVDELNSVIGICRSVNSIKEIDTILDKIQNDLFTLGAELADPIGSKKINKTRIKQSAISRLERVIDEIEPGLKPLRNFILPGGNRTAAELHFARTVCRRAERLAVRLSREERISDQSVIYLNRLSDLLFVLARRMNFLNNTPEKKWVI